MYGIDLFYAAGAVCCAVGIGVLDYFAKTLDLSSWFIIPLMVMLGASGWFFLKASFKRE